MSFMFAQANELYLEILPDDQDTAWQKSQTLTNSAGVWRAYLNRLLLDSFFDYVTEEYSFKVEVANPQRLPQSWSILDGTLVSIEDKRLLLLPTETIDDKEVRISQEWVDIPSWVADYYLVAEVNPDEEWIRVKGYITHLEIKKSGSYDAVTREYSLDVNHIIEDISVLWLSQKFCPSETTIGKVDDLPFLPAKQAENLIQRLGNPDIIFPRLEVPFSLWGALLENEQYLTKLVKLRQGQEVIDNFDNQVTKLTNWLENLVGNLWQNPQSIQMNFAKRKSPINKNISKAKLIKIDNQQVILLMEISEEKDNIMSVKISLYPQPNNLYLPANIELILLSSEGEFLKSKQAINENNYLEISKFKAEKNLVFKVQIKLNSVTRIEEFEV